MKQLSIACSLTLALVILGCNGTNNSAPTPGQAQGVFAGSNSNGLSFETIILPNDQFYAVYGVQSGNILSISGMIAGQGFSNNGKFDAVVTDFVGTGAVHAASVISSYKTGASISGSIAEFGTNNITFTGTSPLASQFNYNTPAMPSDIAGNWTGTLQDGTTSVVSISSGTLVGADSGCSFSGTITPDISGKNFFDTSLTYGGSPCSLPNQTQSGIAIDFLLSDGVTRQLVVSVASGTSHGTVFVANR